MSPLSKLIFRVYLRKKNSSLHKAIFTFFSPPYLNCQLATPVLTKASLWPCLHLLLLHHLILPYFFLSSSSIALPFLSIFFLHTLTKESHKALQTPSILVLGWNLLQSLFPYGHFLTITTCSSFYPLHISTTGSARTSLLALVPVILSFLLILLFQSSSYVARLSENYLYPLHYQRKGIDSNESNWNTPQNI